MSVPVVSMNEAMRARYGVPDVEPGVEFDCTCGCGEALARCAGCGADWAPVYPSMHCPLCETVTPMRALAA